MKRKILIYSIIISCIMTLTQNTECRFSGDSNIQEYSIFNTYDETVCPKDYSFCSTETEFSLPRPTNFTNIPRSLSVAKRTLTRGNDSFCLLKDGKLLNKRSTTQYINNLNRFPSGLTESTHHLISLRKLVI